MECLPRIARGLFNSGSYVINLNKMRKKNYEVKDYLICAELVYEARGKIEKSFFGDQGLMSIMFAGDLKLYAYPEIANGLYMPYNLNLEYFFNNKDRVKLIYPVSVIHYAGKQKPWLFSYPIFLKRFQDKNGLRNLGGLNVGMAEYYYLWHEYAIIANARIETSKIKGL